MQKTIAAAVNVIILIARTPGGRCLKEILLVHGFENGKYITSPMEEVRYRLTWPSLTAAAIVLP
jgi:Flp pilus assembly CpaF family ATPase